MLQEADCAFDDICVEAGRVPLGAAGRHPISGNNAKLQGVDPPTPAAPIYSPPPPALPVNVTCALQLLPVRR